MQLSKKKLLQFGLAFITFLKYSFNFTFCLLSSFGVA